MKKERIVYLALKQINVSYLAFENLNFSIWHQVKIFFFKWHCRLFSLVIRELTGLTVSVFSSYV